MAVAVTAALLAPVVAVEVREASGLTGLLVVVPLAAAPLTFKVPRKETPLADAEAKGATL